MLHINIIILSSLSLAYAIGTDDPRYLGCYKGFISGNYDSRVLPDDLISSRSMTISRCIDFCKGKGLAYAGIEGRWEDVSFSQTRIFCHCGHFQREYGKYGKVEDFTCNYQCPGDSSEICGGEWTLSIYRVCPFGRYGGDCNKSCPHCRDLNCNPINGRCEACSSGYIGEKCETICPSGTYGDDCSNSCPTSCREDTCDHINGTCESCPPGFIGEICNEICTPGSYGINCSSSCHCREETCHHINGSCESCPPGYIGETCDTNCPAGNYGYGCNETCTWHCANNVTCNVVDGSCPGGECQDGFIGSNCELFMSKSNNISGGVISMVIISLMIGLAL